MRFPLTTLALLLGLATSVSAQVNIGIGIDMPGASIGINLPSYPQLVAVPGYPVYYAPQLNANYFFYDGMYWVYQNDDWYASSWYNGPWGRVMPDVVPLYVLRVPVRYYRQPPGYFRGWQREAPPRWGQHWGGDWERNHHGWNQWDRREAARPAPAPTYQRSYPANRYPQVTEQPVVRGQNYRYEPREPVVRQHFEQTRSQAAPQQAQPQQAPGRNPPARAEAPPNQERNAPGRTESNRGRGQGQDKDREKGDERRQDRGK